MGAKEQGADRINGRWMCIPRTLCFVHNDGDVLLIKRGENRKVFPGRYNGLGGHLERDEDPYTGAAREIMEESGLDVTDLRLRAVYNIDAGALTGIILFVFTANSDTRFTIPCDEGTLHWIPLDMVNRLPLVDDLPYLLPRLFGPEAVETTFFVHVSYDENDQIVMRFVP